MNVNVSRIITAKTCWRKAFDRYHVGVSGDRSFNLVDGGAVHKAIAIGLATNDWTAGLAEARRTFDEETKLVQLLPEQQYIIEEHWQIVQKCVRCYEQAFADQNITVVQPECEFAVPLPASHHNCIWLHWLEVVGDRLIEHTNEPPSWQAIAERRVRAPHSSLDVSCFCYQPHTLMGKTDAVVLWQGPMWLLEHKTTSISGEQFWAQWRLDIQPTAYIYGIWKSLHIRPHGFILNAISKPSENQVAAWNSKRKAGPSKSITDYISYSREAFLRDEKDLLRFEQETIEFCDEWEDRIVTGRFPLSPIRGSCVQYNRVCDYHPSCMQHGEGLADMARSEPDYVEQSMQKLRISR